MNKKPEYGYVYYPAGNFSHYGNPEIRIFKIERYKESPDKIYLGNKVLSFICQVDHRNTGPYAFEVRCEPFDLECKEAIKIIFKVNGKKWSNGNKTKIILGVLNKIKAKRLINTGWIGNKSGHDWILYSEKGKYLDQ